MGAGEALRIARRLPDGSIEVDGVPLGVPGDDGIVTLAVIDTTAVVGATEFIVTAMGDWLTKVAGKDYAIHLGVIEDAGELILIGRRAGSARYVDLIHPDGLSGRLRPPVVLRDALDGEPE